MLINKSSLKHTNINQFEETVWLDPTLHEQKLLSQLLLLGRGLSTGGEADQTESDLELSQSKPPKRILCVFVVFSSHYSQNSKIKRKKERKIHKYCLIFQFIATSNIYIEIDQYQQD